MTQFVNHTQFIALAQDPLLYTTEKLEGECIC